MRAEVKPGQTVFVFGKGYGKVVEGDAKRCIVNACGTLIVAKEERPIYGLHGIPEVIPIEEKR